MTRVQFYIDCMTSVVCYDALFHGGYAIVPCQCCAKICGGWQLMEQVK